MPQSSVSEGTKIAQAAKDLNVTSVTIRRYIAEFEIGTTQDDNGIKVLPALAMEELHEIRRLKEDGTSNPRVMEILEEKRAALGVSDKAKPKARPKATRISAAKEETEIADDEETADKAEIKKASADSDSEDLEESAQEGDLGGSKAKHSLTCQTCGKVFEHMNPRLRDCLDCYRTKRKERRRGGSERHKTVIQHPLAQQAASKAPGTQQTPGIAATPMVEEVQAPIPQVIRHTGVRNYRKAIEDTRHITANLKRRLERPDLMEGERRWLEQIYAYQLILHQGWRHLAEYRAQGQQQSKSE